MNINKAKLIVDLLMFIDFIIIALSGFVLWIMLPSGSGAGKFGSESALGLLRHEWISMHNLTSVVLIVLLIIHLILNRRWISYMLKRKK